MMMQKRPISVCCASNIVTVTERMGDSKNAHGNRRLRAGQMILNMPDISEDEKNHSMAHHKLSVTWHSVKLGMRINGPPGFLQKNESGSAWSCHVDAVADQMTSMFSAGNGEDENDGESDKVMDAISERLQRYLNTELCEVSAPKNCQFFTLALDHRLQVKKLETQEDLMIIRERFNPLNFFLVKIGAHSKGLQCKQWHSQMAVPAPVATIHHEEFCVCDIQSCQIACSHSTRQGAGILH